MYLNAKEYSDPMWRLIQGFSVPSLSVERLREIVVEKTAKLIEYHACGHYWLLIVVDHMDPAQGQELVWPATASPVASPYEKILLYNPQYREVLEVPL